VTLVLHHVHTLECQSVLVPQNQPPVMRQGAMKAVVLVFRWPREVVRELASRFACVSLQHEYPGLPVDIVGTNNTHAMQELMRHLYELGHRKIGFVGRCGELSWSRARFAGYVDGLAQMGLEYHRERVLDVPVGDLEAYERPENPWHVHIERVMAQMNRGVRAWMFASDWAAYNVCRGLLDRGVRVPEDISITGFDALREPLFGCPLLTAALVPQHTMGTAALKLVTGRVKDPNRDPTHMVFNCVFRPGATTGPLKI